MIFLFMIMPMFEYKMQGEREQNSPLFKIVSFLQSSNGNTLDRDEKSLS